MYVYCMLYLRKMLYVCSILSVKCMYVCMYKFENLHHHIWSHLAKNTQILNYSIHKLKILIFNRFTNECNYSR